MKRKNWINKDEASAEKDFDAASVEHMKTNIKNARNMASVDEAKGVIKPEEAKAIRKACDELGKIVEKSSNENGEIDIDSIREDGLRAIFHLSVLRRYNVSEERAKLDIF